MTKAAINSGTLSALTLSILGITPIASAENTAVTTNSNASVRIMSPSSTTLTNTMNIGSVNCIDGHKNLHGKGHEGIQSPGHECEIIITPTAPGSAKAITFDGTFGSQDTSQINSAQFTIQGAPGQQYRLALPQSQSVRVINATGDSAFLNVIDFTGFSSNTGMITSSGAFDGNGIDIITVGATVCIPSHFEWQLPVPIDIALEISY